MSLMFSFLMLPHCHWVLKLWAEFSPNLLAETPLFLPRKVRYLTTRLFLSLLAIDLSF